MTSLLEFYSLLLLVFCISIERVDAQFMAEILQPATRSGPRRPVERCEATGASFGADVASFSFGDRALGCAVVVEPNDACTDVTYTPLGNETTCVNLFAIVPRGKCNFSEKAYHVQRASPVPFAALIIYNSRGKPPVDMMGGKYSDRVHIPVIMVSFVCMEAMINKYPVTDGFMVRIKLSPGYYDLFRYLIPFVVVVGFCFLVLLVSLAIRLCREHRRIARKRLSKRNLRKIPTKKYRKGDHPDTCAICLDDFVDGEKLRVLPCRHCYHCKCIDPWLTQNRKVCPMCKRRVGEKNSDSESSDDEERRRQMQPSTSSSVMTVVSSADSAAHQMEEGRRHTHEGNSPPHSPVPTPHSSVSNVLVEVHHGLGGSREQLVEDEFLSDQEAHREEGESDLDEDEEAEASLSQSLKKRLKGLFNRSNNGETSNANTDTESGRVNGAFAGSIHSLSNETRDGGGTSGGAAENRENPGQQGSAPHESNSGQPGASSDRFRDPFDDSHVAATSVSRDRDTTENAPTAGVDAEGERK